ncbi:hypothetical protein [Streptomyces iranensis]|uniref:hypothetical protein n=1 Tax=Streptomyces iranensis TaxID=576784 RepID=UPI0039B7866B
MKTGDLPKLLITEAKGKRPRMGAPRFKSRRDNRQAVRFTANARWKFTADGTKIDAPRFLRRAEKKLKRAQGSAPKLSASLEQGGPPSSSPPG